MFIGFKTYINLLCETMQISNRLFNTDNCLCMSKYIAEYKTLPILNNGFNILISKLMAPDKSPWTE